MPLRLYTSMPLCLYTSMPVHLYASTSLHLYMYFSTLPLHLYMYTSRLLHQSFTVHFFCTLFWLFFGILHCTPLMFYIFIVIISPRHRGVEVKRIQLAVEQLFTGHIPKTTQIRTLYSASMCYEKKKHAKNSIFSNSTFAVPFMLWSNLKPIFLSSSIS